MTYIPGMQMAAWRLARGDMANGKAGLGPKRKVGAEIFGDGPYPQSFPDFVGQETARLQILTAITAARKTGTVMDHMLLSSGTPGIGKTTLAKLTAHRLGVGMVELGGLVGDREVKAALHAMRRGDVLFLDEIHRIFNRGKARGEWLLQLMQDGELVTPTGVVTSPGITIIGATTDAQKLPETILDRFVLRPVLDPYTDEEAALIALAHARRLGFGTTDGLPLPEEQDWLTRIAMACNNNPRRMGMLLISVRNITLTDGPSLGPEGYDLSMALEWGRLTDDGLDQLAQGYLTGLYGYGGHAGIGTLRALLDEEQLRITEKLLIQKGMVQVTSKGRELTGMGFERAQALVEEAMSA
jgi:Holliday junction resolvasome RuvABC ATP-dependent DNA helicase subunit